LSAWPVEEPGDWLKWINPPQTDGEVLAGEVLALRKAIEKGRPFGDSKWQRSMVRRLGLQSSLRKPGRPKKRAKAEEGEP
jgi:hypothetical protein